MIKQGSKILHILRKEEKKARLRFWSMLLRMGGQYDLACPFTEEPPENAVYFGKMPRYMRAAFIRAYTLRTEERRAEAEVFEEAISELLQEHFRLVLEARKRGTNAPIGQFRLGKDWAVYAVPL